MYRNSCIGTLVRGNSNTQWAIRRVQKAAQVKSEGPLQSKILRVFRRNPQRVHFVKRILAVRL